MTLGLKRPPLARSGRTGETSDDHQRADLREGLGPAQEVLLIDEARAGHRGEVFTAVVGCVKRRDCDPALPLRMEASASRPEPHPLTGKGRRRPQAVDRLPVAPAATPLPNSLTVPTGAQGGARAAVTTTKPALRAGCVRYRYGDSNPGFRRERAAS
jgi:hypothetical protein